ncbi:MAG: hypothetical protein FWD17_17450, partial [Polyangiaceae bacterium]|nr:hypothetical protein [Polyangiaceae bacterium]
MPTNFTPTQPATAPTTATVRDPGAHRVLCGTPDAEALEVAEAWAQVRRMEAAMETGQATMLRLPPQLPSDLHAATVLARAA